MGWFIWFKKLDNRKNLFIRNLILLLAYQVNSMNFIVFIQKKEIIIVLFMMRALPFFTKNFIFRKLSSRDHWKKVNLEFCVEENAIIDWIKYEVKLLILIFRWFFYEKYKIIWHIYYFPSLMWKKKRSN